MLKYFLVENFLGESQDSFTAQVQSSGSYDKDAIINLMLRRGNLLTRTDILAVLNGLEEVVCEIISEGGTINMPLFNSSFSISGVFDNPMDSFDGGRHKLNVNLSKGTLLRTVEANVKFEKTQSIASQPLIVEVKDSLSGISNAKLTSGGIIELFGNNIKIIGDDAACGLWFVPATGEAIKSATIVRNKPASIIASIPQLPAGSYSIKVVTQFSGGSLLKTPKTYTYPKTLVVTN